MRHLSQATIRQFLRTAAVALALGNEAAQAASGGQVVAKPPLQDKENSTLALAQKARSGPQLQIAGSHPERRARRPQPPTT
ncbi:MAG: hypothetical protein KDH20_05775 [Rhodocyclaceae bacterium]|nr:hypothetical protein [Rhodocyclaceae bacterium]